MNRDERNLTFPMIISAPVGDRGVHVFWAESTSWLLHGGDVSRRAISRHGRIHSCAVE